MVGEEREGDGCREGEGNGCRERGIGRERW